MIKKEQITIECIEGNRGNLLIIAQAPKLESINEISNQYRNDPVILKQAKDRAKQAIIRHVYSNILDKTTRLRRLQAFVLRNTHPQFLNETLEIVKVIDELFDEIYQ